MQYIKGAPRKNLLCKKNSHIKIEAYINTNYVEDRDDMRSTYRFCTYVGGNLVR